MFIGVVKKTERRRKVQLILIAKKKHLKASHTSEGVY